MMGLSLRILLLAIWDLSTTSMFLSPKSNEGGLASLSLVSVSQWVGMLLQGDSYRALSISCMYDIAIAEIERKRQDKLIVGTCIYMGRRAAAG